MVVAAPRGLKGLAQRGLRRLARWRLRTLSLQAPVDLWALRTWRAMKRTPAPAIIN
jgi:hypothetical protein